MSKYLDWFDAKEAHRKAAEVHQRKQTTESAAGLLKAREGLDKAALARDEEARRMRQPSPRDIADVAIAMAALPGNKANGLKQLAGEAANFLDHCAAVAYSRRLSRAEWQALQVEDTIYCHLVNPIRKAYANGEFVSHERAAKELTGLRTAKEAVVRFDEFMLELPSLDPKIPVSQEENGQFVLGLDERGITRPFLEALRPVYQDWWKAYKSESAKQKGHKSRGVKK
jgi:hypothetical protein